MDPITVKQREEKISTLLDDKDVTTIVLVGKPGIGKTWMARKICDQVREVFDIILWVYLNRKYDKWALYENIACQLSLLSTTEEKDDDDSDAEVEEHKEDKEASLEKLKQKISTTLANKRCLLVLDDEGNRMKEDEIMSEFKTLLPLNHQNQCKVLITTISGDSGRTIEGTKTGIEVVSFEPLTEGESLQLLRERAEIFTAEFSSFERHFRAVIKKSERLPSTIIMIAEVLKHLWLRKHDVGVWTFERALEEVGYNENYHTIDLLRSGFDMLPETDMINCCWHSRQFFHDRGSVHYNELIAYWILEGYLGEINHIEKAYEKGHSILMELVNRGMLTKQEDNFVGVEGALLEVDDRRRDGFYGTSSLGLENVSADGEWGGLGKITWVDGMIKSLSHGGKWQKLSTLLIDGNRLCREVPDLFFSQFPGLQVLALFNPRFKSVPLSLSKLENLLVLVLRGCCLLDNVDHIQELQKLTVLEISGASSLKKLPNDLFKQMPNLERLNLSGSHITEVPSIEDLSKLRWLILRGCPLLHTLPSIKTKLELEVLDLCGATSLNTIKDRKLEVNKKLQFLDFSQAQVEKLPFLPNLQNLSRLLARGSPCLARLPAMTALTGLQVLDVSGSALLREIPDEPSKGNIALRIFDLSGTAITKYPPNTWNIRNLYLRGCSSLLKLPSTVPLKDLELIDLSDAAELEEITDDSFEHLSFLRLLNLSNTKIQRLPSLSNLSSLCEILLKGCSLLEELPKMDGLTRLEMLDLTDASSLENIQHLDHENLRLLLLKGCRKLDKLPQLGALLKLEVLDLSGCEALTEIPEGSFEHMTHLIRLDLSKTKVKSLPSLSKLDNLSHLSLRDCENLEALPPLESLSKLEELDLSGASSLKEFNADFVEHMNQLRILDFSGRLVRLPSMSKLRNLIQLKLQGCSELDTIPHLEVLTNLEILDLSETKISSLPSLSHFSNLHELLLRGLNLDGLLNLKSLSHLEVLNLSGTKLKEFPSEFSELPRLKHLHFPVMDGMRVEWEKIKCLPEEIDLGEVDMIKLIETLRERENKKLSISMTGTKLFEICMSIPGFWETHFKQFHFSVCSADHRKDRDTFGHGEETMFREIDTQTKKFSYPYENYRSLEIRGFSDIPSGVKDVLSCAEFVSLIDNKSLSCLSDLGADNIKGCWIERCNGMVNVLTSNLAATLEILWASNMANLKSLCSFDTVQSESFNNLKELYLDCCPMLVNVFSPSQVPESLEILQIKFCDRLETVFGDGKLEESKMNKLHKLHLLELPELKSIGSVFPSLQILEVRECPKLQNIEDMELVGNSQSENLKVLKCLSLDSCPGLINVFSSSYQAEKLETLQIKFCNNLETVFEGYNASLTNLRTLRLWNLPELKSIGEVLLPPQLTKDFRKCPNLQLQ